MFKDRKDGGEKLAIALEKYSNQHAIVLGIARGGVETAYYVARHLHAELYPVVSRKLGYPFNPELAFGALAEDGSIFIFEDSGNYVTDEVKQTVIEAERQEIKKRVKNLRKGKSLPSLQGRTVLVVDDGIATGATLFATLELCKNQKARKIIVAAPVAHDEIERELINRVDDVVILLKPSFFQSVSQGYYSFTNLTDADVLTFMDRWEKEMVKTA